MTDYSPTGRPKRDTIGMGTDYEDPPFMAPMREQMDREHLERAAAQTFTLGQLIEALQAFPAELRVRFAGAGISSHVPTRFTSWRGVYADLALEPEAQEDDPEQVPLVADLLRWCEAADGAVFEGWKGGDFTMDRWTPVWVDVEGESTGRGIVGVDRFTVDSVDVVAIYTAIRS